MEQDTQLLRVIDALETAINNIAGQVQGIIAVLEEMDLPSNKKIVIMDKLARLMSAADQQGAPAAEARKVVQRVLRD